MLAKSSVDLYFAIELEAALDWTGVIPKGLY